MNNYNYGYGSDMYIDQQINAMQQQLDALKRTRQMSQQRNIPPTQPLQENISQPTIHAAIMQVENEDVMRRYPLGIGESQMFIDKNETIIGVKRVISNNETTFDAFDKRSEKHMAKEESKQCETANQIDMSQYVRKDEIKEYILSCMTGKKAGE